MNLRHYALIVLAGLVFTGSAQAATVSHATVLGHGVRSCTWRATSHINARVAWTPRLELVSRRARGAICAINGNTYDGRLRPVGPVRANGHWVTQRDPAAPVYGFAHHRIIFGWRAVRAAKAHNVMSGKAWLVRGGKAIRRHAQAPYTTPAQFACGARGTDGWYGCYRTAAVQYRNGRFGLVSIALASMPEAGRILVRMGVVTAVTGDSGGGAEAVFNGHSFGSIPATGPRASWRRAIPDAVIIRK